MSKTAKNLTVDFDYIFSFTELDDEWKKFLSEGSGEKSSGEKAHTHECKTGMTAVYVNISPEEIKAVPEEKDLLMKTIKEQMSILRKSRDAKEKLDHSEYMFVDWIIHACDYEYTDKSVFEKALMATCIKHSKILINLANE